MSNASPAQKSPVRLILTEQLIGSTSFNGGGLGGGEQERGECRTTKAGAEHDEVEHPVSQGVTSEGDIGAKPGRSSVRVLEDRAKGKKRGIPPKKITSAHKECENSCLHHHATKTPEQAHAGYLEGGVPSQKNRTFDPLVPLVMLVRWGKKKKKKKKRKKRWDHSWRLGKVR